MSNVGLVWRTVRHFSIRQVVYQLLHRIRKPALLHLPESAPTACFLAVPVADKPTSYRCDEFTFLNQSSQFTVVVNWNYSASGKLWTYHLNYFDFLNQPDMTPDTGLRLLMDFIAQTADLRTGLESYPISLRIQNWVQFLSRHQLQNDAINRHLRAQIASLNKRIEYHLSANHLLENGFALLMGALYFQNNCWLQKAVKLIRQELTAQILADGGDYERSPVYHQILLDRLLDVLLSLQATADFYDIYFVDFLHDQAIRMLCWLTAITFRNGDVPMVNDAAPDMALTTAQLQQKAITIGINPNYTLATLMESGYRMFQQLRYELLADVGPVGPDHQPGHAHADTLSFVLYVDNQPVIVDTGTSTYQPGSRREWERSTAAHNTITIDECDSSEVWSVFRVGRRAQVTVLNDTQTELTAFHDGYRHLGCIHERTWQCEQTRLVITDRLLKAHYRARFGMSGVARFYFHSSVPVHYSEEVIWAGPLKITLSSATKPEFIVTTEQLANGFNRFQSGHCLKVRFTSELETVVTFCG